MAGSLEGKVAPVASAAFSIGRAAVQPFVREGAKVVAADIDDGGSERTAPLGREMGGEVLCLHADVSKAPEPASVIGATVEAYGGLDCAFNHAGMQSELAPTAERTEEDLDRTIASTSRVSGYA
jgi:NAD(P)-dependent dehydrogenase (short-subunit alcohol dehydrogenase family)